MKIKKIPDFYEPFPNMENIDKGSAVYDIVTADHIEKAKKRKKEMEKDFRAARKGVGITDKEYEDGYTGRHEKKIKSKEMKAMHLSENLFESMELPDVQVGDTLEIEYMEGEPQYAGRVGTVEHIDGIGQIHGTWGGCALCKDYGDRYHKLEEALQEKLTPEEKKARMQAKWDKKYGTYVAVMNELTANMCSNDSGFDKTRKFPWNSKITDRGDKPMVPESERYNQDDIGIDPTDPDGLTYRVYADTPERLDFAKQVCDEYGLPWKEDSAEYRSDPTRRYWVAFTFTEDQLEGADDWDWDEEDDEELLTDSWNINEGMASDFVTDFVQAASRVCYQHRYDDLTVAELSEAIQTFFDSIENNSELEFLLSDEAKKKLESLTLDESLFDEDVVYDYANTAEGDYGKFAQNRGINGNEPYLTKNGQDRFVRELHQAEDAARRRAERENSTINPNYKPPKNWESKNQGSESEEQVVPTVPGATSSDTNRGTGNNIDVMVQNNQQKFDWYDDIRREEANGNVYNKNKDDYIVDPESDEAKKRGQTDSEGKKFTDYYNKINGDGDPNVSQFIYQRRNEDGDWETTTKEDFEAAKRLAKANPDDKSLQAKAKAYQRVEDPEYGKSMFTMAKDQLNRAEQNIYQTEKKRAATQAKAISNLANKVKEIGQGPSQFIGGLNAGLGKAHIKHRF